MTSGGALGTGSADCCATTLSFAESHPSYVPSVRPHPAVMRPTAPAGRRDQNAHSPCGPELSGARTWSRIAAWGFAFACFLPYPALALGSNTGLQISQAMAVAMMPLLCLRAPGRSFRALVVILVPVTLSAFVNLVSGTTLSPDLLPKEGIAIALAVGVLWPAEWVARRALFRQALSAACVALLFHALIGLVQVYGFAHDEFPLLFLYKNPSFKPMESWSDIYARYIKRPCGLFPEPSAMTSSLGPWVVLLAGLLLDGRLARSLGWRGGRMAASALGLGFVLIALSRSGATFVIMASIAVFCAAKAPSWARMFGPGKLAASALVLLAALAAVGYGTYRLSGSLDDRIESSWGLRALSIHAGLTANTDPTGLAFGVGPGHSTPVLRRALAWVRLPDDQDDLAVFSLAVCYYMETGFLGALALAAVLCSVLYAIIRSSARLLGVCALCTWLFAVGATTSYIALSPIWLFLAALLAWDSLFPATMEVACK